jgi:hypothetical protein
MPIVGPTVWPIAGWRADVMEGAWGGGGQGS